MPSEPMRYAFTLIREALYAYDSHKPWPPAMCDLQRFIYEEYPELVPLSGALIWAEKAVRPAPTCDNWREPERLKSLRKAAELAAQELRMR